MNLFEHGQVVPLIMPVDLNTAAVDGDWINLENYNGANFIVLASIGTAGDDVVVSFDQASDATGTGAKALSVIATIYEKEGATAISAVGQFTKQTQTASDSYESTTGAENEQCLGFYINAAQLDLANGFSHVRLSTSDVGTNAQLGCALCVLTDARYPQEPALSAID